MIRGKAIWKPGIGETSKAFRGIAPEPHKVGFPAPHMNPQLQEVILLMHIGLWPTSIKLNLSWKSEVSRSAWINPWMSMGTYMTSLFFLFFLSGNLDNRKWAYVVYCTIWYYLYNLKNVKNTTSPWVFFTFFLIVQMVPNRAKHHIKVSKWTRFAQNRFFCGFSQNILLDF